MTEGPGRKTATVLLLVILIFGGAVRVLRCHFGLPYPVHWDEPLVVESGLRILGGGGWEPYTFRYGTPAIYLSAAVSALAYLHDSTTGTTSSLADWTERQPTRTDSLAVVTQAPSAWFWSRVVFSVLALFAVWGAYALARSLLLCRTASLVAAAVVAVSPLHVAQSATATVDALGLTFIIWSLVFLVRRYPDDLSFTRVGASALLAGIAVATKFGFLPIAGIVIAGALLGSGPWRARLRVTLWSAAVFAASFLAASPFSLISIHSYLAAVGTELQHYAVIGHDAQQQRLSWGVFARIWQALSFPGIPGWILLALAGSGVAGLLVTGSAARRRSLLLLATTAVWALSLGRLIVFFERSAVPFLPLLAVLAAGGVQLLVAQDPFGRLRGVRLVVAGLLCVAAVGPVGAQQFTEAVRQWRFVDSRQQLVAWLIEEARPGQTIAVSQQLPLYLGELRRHRLNITLVDPVTDPCWFTREPYDFFATSSDQGAGWPAPVFAIDGAARRSGIPS